MMLVDYHVHALGHGEYQHSPASIGAFAATARARGIAEIGFADHAYYYEQFDFTTFAAVQEQYPEVKIQLGMEVDYYPGQGEAIRTFLRGYKLDFVIGSVHNIGDWTFDHPDYRELYGLWEKADLYRAYYGILSEAAGAGLFDIIGHLDLIKVFNYRLAGAVDYAEPAIAAIARSGLCVELNTNGRYKPVGEFYPEPAILERCFAANIPITLGSDAHAPENVGRDLALAAECAKRAGYRRIAAFAGRERRLVSL